MSHSSAYCSLSPASSERLLAGIASFPLSPPAHCCIVYSIGFLGAITSSSAVRSPGSLTSSAAATEPVCSSVKSSLNSSTVSILGASTPAGTGGTTDGFFGKRTACLFDLEPVFNGVPHPLSITSPLRTSGQKGHRSGVLKSDAALPVVSMSDMLLSLRVVTSRGLRACAIL